MVRLVKKYMKVGGRRTLVIAPVGAPITFEEFDRRTRHIFKKMAKRIEELERQGKHLPRRVS